MIFKKGSKVEVLDKRELPSGSWWCAEIVSGNGHYYNVKHVSDSEGTCVTVERVPRKVIRPSPPSVMSPRCWVPGDIVEVYEKNSWKVAEVSRIVGVSYFLVRLLGSTRKLWAHISDLRMRLVWEDDKWVAIQKEFRECNNGIRNIPSKAGEFGHQMHQSCIEVKTRWGDDQLSIKYDGSIEESCWAPLGSKKRKKCLYSSQIDTCPGDHKKMRSVEETGRKGRVLETLPSHLLDKDISGDYYNCFSTVRHVLFKANRNRIFKELGFPIESCQKNMRYKHLILGQLVNMPYQSRYMIMKQVLDGEGFECSPSFHVRVYS